MALLPKMSFALILTRQIKLHLSSCTVLNYFFQKKKKKKKVWHDAVMDNGHLDH